MTHKVKPTELRTLRERATERLENECYVTTILVQDLLALLDTYEAVYPLPPLPPEPDVADLYDPKRSEVVHDITDLLL